MCKAWVKEGVWERKPVSAWGQLCLGAWIHLAEGNWLLQSLRAQHRRQASGPASRESPWYSTCHVTCAFPILIVIDLKTVTKSCSTGMSYVIRDFRGGQSGQNNEDYRKFHVSSWTFSDVWSYAILWKRPVTGDLLSWLEQSEDINTQGSI